MRTLSQRSFLLCTMAAYVVAWLVPAVEDQAAIWDGKLPGWEAVQYAAAFDGYGANALLNGLVQATAWTNLVFLVAVALGSTNAISMRTRTFIGIVLVTSTLLNAHWILLAVTDGGGGGIGVLRVGYFLWLAAFCALTAWIFRSRRRGLGIHAGESAPEPATAHADVRLTTPADVTMRYRLALALLWLFGALPVAAQNNLPIEFRADASGRGCVPVSDTTLYPGLETPLFRFGVYEVGKDTLRRASGAYWCLMSDESPGTALVIWRDWESGAPVSGGCGSVIHYRGLPGGLRFERRGVVQLREAHLVEDPKRRGPRVAARGAVIVSERGGVTARFICHVGRWYVALST